jgi:hypothetical protein
LTSRIYHRWAQTLGASQRRKEKKSRLATAVQGRSYWSQSRELWLLTITHNLMILYVSKGFLQSTPGPVSAPDPKGKMLELIMLIDLKPSVVVNN